MGMMSVCCLCGDKGRIKELIRCVECEVDVSVVHRYCKGLQESETAGWTCEDCCERKMLELRGLSRKSSRLEDRWIKKSNYKAILKPNTTDVKIKACFRCGYGGNVMDLIDCEQCYSFFVHRQCKLPQESSSPESEWTCESCMDKKRMQLIHHSSHIKQTSRIRPGWMPSQKLSDKQLLLGYQDHIFQNECGVRLSEQSSYKRPANKLIKVRPPSVQMENNQKDHPDIFVDDDYSATEAIRNAQYRHQKVEPVNDKSSDKKWGSYSGKASSKIIKPRAEDLQLTPCKGDGSNHVEQMSRKRTTDYSDIFSDDDKRVSPVSSNARKGLFQILPYRPLQIGLKNDTSSDTWVSNHGRASKKLMQEENMKSRKLTLKYSEFVGEEDARIGQATNKSKNKLSQVVRDWPHNFRHGNDTTPVKKRGIIEQSLELGQATNKSKNKLSQVVRDWPHNFRHGNDTTPVKKRGIIEQSLELMDQSAKGTQHDATGIQTDPVKRRHEYVPAEPKKNPVWQGLVRVKVGNYKADIELFCYPSTKCSSKATAALNGLSSMITFSFKYRSNVWPKRFEVSPLTDEAIAVYFLPQSEKDAVAYDGLLDLLVKYKFALQYEISSKNQNLLVFPSCLLPTESHKLGRKDYMWGYLEEKERRMRMTYEFSMKD